MRTYWFLMLILLFSCTEKEKRKIAKPAPQHQNTQVAAKSDSVLHHWESYYKSSNPEFTVDKFELKQTSEITFSESPVKILNQKGFNEVYKSFLVFNKTGDQYIDFDSYHWFVAPDGSASFEPDQQVVLVDLKKKTANQIAFLGPSYAVEDAFWKGDSVAVLLGNSYEKVPFISEYNFRKNKHTYFQYPDTLKFEIPYSEIRLKKKGIRLE